jgi:hypothetical protein
MGAEPVVVPCGQSTSICSTGVSWSVPMLAIGSLMCKGPCLRELDVLLNLVDEGWLGSSG